MIPGPEPLLSVLIATLAHREDRFLSLLGGLLPQAEASPAEVEVVALQNNGARPLSDYRDQLLQAARGTYLCFVDDDDQVAGNYVEELVSALETDPDCVGFRQLCTGLAALYTELSLKNENAPWDPVFVNGELTYLRQFSHVMPVRSALAKQAGFQGSPLDYTGEDVAYVRQVVPLLRQRGSREAYIGKALYHYIWSAADSTQAGRLPPGKQIAYGRHPRPRVVSPCFRWCP